MMKEVIHWWIISDLPNPWMVALSTWMKLEAIWGKNSWIIVICREGFHFYIILHVQNLNVCPFLPLSTLELKIRKTYTSSVFFRMRCFWNFWLISRFYPKTDFFLFWYWKKGTQWDFGHTIPCSLLR